MAAIASHQPANLTRADLARGVLRTQIADDPVRHTNIQRDQRFERFIHDPGVEQLERRDSQSFLKYLRAVRGVRSGHPAADVGVVADHDRPGENLAAVEDG